MNVAVPFLVLLFLSTLVATPVTADDACIACHAGEGARAYIDVKVLEQSVHKGIGCTQCHLNVSGYPHGRVGRVRCGICHFLGREGAPEEQALEYKMSVHGVAARLGKADAPVCQTCHGSHAIYPSSDARSSTSRMNIPTLCSQCHEREFALYRRSVHGIQFLERKNAAAAVCFDCHLEHRTPDVKTPQWKLALIQECGGCHPRELETYRETYHGKVTELGYATIAKCPDCHGSHGILPPSDPGSKLSRENIVATCGTCHHGVTPRFTEFYAHPDETDRENYPVLYYTWLFMTVLLVGVFTFFLTHTALWAFRALKERRSGKRGE